MADARALRDEAIAAAAGVALHDRAALLLRVRLGHDFRHAFAVDHGKALQPQRRQQRGIHETLRHG
ncbi:MAG: hypothetical protein ACJ8E0_04045, partial [Sphingomicrobium sp.]